MKEEEEASMAGVQGAKGMQWEVRQWVGHSAGAAVVTLRIWVISPEQWETGDHSSE